MPLTGQIAVITGANGHLGQAVVRRFAAAGARLALLGRDQAALQAVAAGLEATVYVCDVTDEPAVAAALRQAGDDLGTPYALLNVVGGYAFGAKVQELDLATWQQMLSLNLTSAFLCAKHVLPAMLAAGEGRILNVSSKVALDLPAGAAAYAVAKAGVNALTACLAKELRGTGVAVAALMPSIIDTPPNRASLPKADPAKWVTPEQIADAMLLLCAREAAALNGAIVPVFGGL